MFANQNQIKQQENHEEVLYVRVDGMYCEHCWQKVRSALLVLDGVETVSFRHTVAELRGSALPDAEAVVSAIREAGYEANPSRVSKDFRCAGMRRLGSQRCLSQLASGSTSCLDTTYLTRSL